MSEWPVIDQEKCDACGLCVSVCRCGSLVLRDGVVIVAGGGAECRNCRRWCGLCEDVCPRGAISCPLEIVVENG